MLESFVAFSAEQDTHTRYRFHVPPSLWTGDKGRSQCTVFYQLRVEYQRIARSVVAYRVITKHEGKHMQVMLNNSAKEYTCCDEAQMHMATT